jgi:hypothetical protein
MKGGTSISPGVAGIIIAVAAVVAVLFVYRAFRPPSKAVVNPDQVKRMQGTDHGTLIGGKIQTSRPPAGAVTGQ